VLEVVDRAVVGAAEAAVDVADEAVDLRATRRREGLSLGPSEGVSLRLGRLRWK